MVFGIIPECPPELAFSFAGIGMRHSNEFYFVTPAGLINAAKIPADCGLLEAGHATSAEWKELISRPAGFFSYDPDNWAYCMITVPAPWRETPGPTWQLVAAMLRHQRRQFAEQPSPARHSNGSN